MRKMAIGSENVVSRIRRMLAVMQEKARLRNVNRYEPPIIWRQGMRMQRNLHGARRVEHRRAPDDGRPAGMSGRQWKRLQKAERILGSRSSSEKVAAQQIAEGTLSIEECLRRIARAHASCDRPDTGMPFRRPGSQRRLRVSLN